MPVMCHMYIFRTGHWRLYVSISNIFQCHLINVAFIINIWNLRWSLRTNIKKGLVLIIHITQQLLLNAYFLLLYKWTEYINLYISTSCHMSTTPKTSRTTTSVIYVISESKYTCSWTFTKKRSFPKFREKDVNSLWWDWKSKRYFLFLFRLQGKISLMLRTMF